MNKYIVITTGGTAHDESGNEVSQCIYLGTFYAPDYGAAIDLAKEQVDNLEQDFCVHNMKAYKLDDKEKI